MMDSNTFVTQWPSESIQIIYASTKERGTESISSQPISPIIPFGLVRYRIKMDEKTGFHVLRDSGHPFASYRNSIYEVTREQLDALSQKGIRFSLVGPSETDQYNTPEKV